MRILTALARVSSKLLIVALIGAALAGCGRKAPLDTPYQAGIDARREAADRKEPLPPESKPPVEDRKFILDKLL